MGAEGVSRCELRPTCPSCRVLDGGRYVAFCEACRERSAEAFAISGVPATDAFAMEAVKLVVRGTKEVD